MDVDPNKTPQLVDSSPSKAAKMDDVTPSHKVSHKRKKRSSQKRSEVWNHFTVLQRKLGEDARAACNYCQKQYACDTNRVGTSKMLSHVNNQCKKYPPRVQLLHDKTQTTLAFKPKKETDEGGSSAQLVSWSFSTEACRRALAEMLIIDELPFRFVEAEGFKRLMQVVQPKWNKLPSRITIARDCLDIYVEEKKTLKRILKDQRVCLTTDTWTSIQNLNYMCLTAHYIDSNWKLQKKIINFCLVPNHKGETLGKHVEMCLLEWGIDKILTLTVDNAASNNLCISHLKRKTKNRRGTVLEHEFLHVRCCAHILNLIVRDGLKDIDDSIVKVRAAVKYVKSSPSRMAKFKSCAQKETIECKSQVCLDVSTRWNSTYIMLERAIHYQKAFERLEEEDNYFLVNLRDDDVDSDGDRRGESGRRNLGPPTCEDWDKARLYVKFLKIFYNATLRFSGSQYVTANLAYTEILAIQNSIASLCKNNDISLRLMAEGMRAKFDKYWGNLEKMNLAMLIAVVLDPRYKLKYVKWCFEKYYDSLDVDVGGLVKKVKDSVIRLYNWYDANDSNNVVQNTNLTEQHRRHDDTDEEDVHALLVSQFKRHLVEKESMRSKSEIKQFLLEGCVEDTDKFNIMEWWKSNASRYRILSKVARDVLAIPVSTVASESAFSTGGCVLDSFRSSMSPKTTEALICCQNWLRSSPTTIDIRDAMEELEEYESLESELTSIDATSWWWNGG